MRPDEPRPTIDARSRFATSNRSPATHFLNQPPTVPSANRAFLQGTAAMVDLSPAEKKMMGDRNHHPSDIHAPPCRDCGTREVSPETPDSRCTECHAEATNNTSDEPPC